MTTDPVYGQGDSSYQAAGGLEGLTALVTCFYELMDTLPEAAELRAMHPRDLTSARDKLIAFLSGWLGGPPLYSQQYGQRTLPDTHRHFPVTAATRDAWLACMEQALIIQNYPESFRTYLLARLAVPAESIRLMAAYKPDPTLAALARPAD